MALKEIMAISGYSGLYKFVSQGRNGIIVESLTDGKRTHIPASAKVSALSDIAIFTNDGEKSLREVMNNIKTKENSAPTISHKASKEELVKFFSEIEPNYDVDRVYVSDIKKVVAWYNQLQSMNMLDFEEEVVEDDTTTEKSTEKAPEEAKGEKAPAKKKAAPKTGEAKDKKPSAPKKTPTAKAKPTSGAVPKKAPHQKKS